MSILEKILKIEEEAHLLKEEALQNRENEFEKTKQFIKEFEERTINDTKKEVEKLLKEENKTLKELEDKFNKEINDIHEKLLKSSKDNIAKVIDFLNMEIYKWLFL